MKVTVQSLWIALKTIFDSYEVRVGGQLLLEDIQADWQQSGFRDQDLQRAIDSSSEAGLFERTDYDGEPCVRILTARLPDDVDSKADNRFARLLKRTGNAAKVQRARRRARGGNAPATDRRRESENS